MSKPLPVTRLIIFSIPVLLLILLDRGRGVWN